MARTVARTLAAPLLFLNLIMYFIVLGFASWCLNKFINGQTHHPTVGGNGATMFFLAFSILAAVLGIVSKFCGGNHLRVWRNDSLAAAGSSAIVAWAVTALAFGVLEAFVIILAFTQLLYVLMLHAGWFSSRYGPGYRDNDYGMGMGGPTAEKGTTGVTGTRV
nr:membrane protein PM19L-like [Ipomoea batatas]